MLDKLKKLLLFIALLPISACGTNTGAGWFMDEGGRLGTLTPKPLFLGELPQGDDDYSKGFRDGCNSAISVVGTGLQSMFYEDIYYDFDKIVDSPDYYKGKTIGFDYCTYYIDVDPL
jgi:hypothetical protein